MGGPGRGPGVKAMVGEREGGGLFAPSASFLSFLWRLFFYVRVGDAFLSFTPSFKLFQRQCPQYTNT